MTNSIENEEKNEEEILETKEIPETNEIVKKAEPVPKVTATKYTRPPAFQKPGNLGRGNFQTNNNRQRPGRAAGRGR